MVCTGKPKSKLLNKSKATPQSVNTGTGTKYRRVRREAHYMKLVFLNIGECAERHII